MSAKVKTPSGDPGLRAVSSTTDRPGNVPASTASPRTEVLSSPVRRQFTLEYKLRILEEAQVCENALEIGMLLRREGLYSYHLKDWRRSLKAGRLKGVPRKVAEAMGHPPLVSHTAHQALLRELDRTRRKLHQAEQIIEVQKKVSRLWELELDSHEPNDKGYSGR